MALVESFLYTCWIAQYTLLPNLDSYFATVETQVLLALSLFTALKDNAKRIRKE
jgi:hypothetical protein